MLSALLFASMLCTTAIGVFVLVSRMRTAQEQVRSVFVERLMQQPLGR